MPQCVASRAAYALGTVPSNAYPLYVSLVQLCTASRGEHQVIRILAFQMFQNYRLGLIRNRNVTRLAGFRILRLHREYTESIFPTEQYEEAFKTLYSHYQANTDDSLTLDNVSQFLECLSHTLLEYMRKEATLSFYSQLEKNTQDSLFSRCYYDQSFSRAYNHWTHDDSETLFQLVNYVGHSNLDITMRIDTSISTMDSIPSQITLIARERNADHVIDSVTIPFNYGKWFTCIKPTEIKMSGIIGKDAPLDTGTVTVWEGDLWEELYGERLSLRRFSYLYPFLLNRKITRKGPPPNRPADHFDQLW